MLPSTHRLTDGESFRRVTRSSRRAGSRTLVCHLVVQPEAPVRAGFVVSRAVGGAVTRNRVKRRLRHLVAERLQVLPGGSQLVVRALPASASASYAHLGADLDHCLDRVATPAGSRA